MLTGDMVRARAEKGVLKPGFIDPASPRLLERAERLLVAFREAIGSKRSELDERIEGILGDDTDRKLADGLVKVLLDKSVFDVSAAVEPVVLRRAVFLEAARRGPVVAVPIEGAVTADEVFAAVAAELGVPVEGLPDALYADHPDEQVLQRVDIGTPQWLLNRYNVALVQALLLHADHVDITLVGVAPPRARQLLRQVKFHQLIHHARKTEAGLEIRLDGPASLFAQTSRYGMALARFFPALLLQSSWSMTANVAWGRFRPTLSLSPAQGLVSHYRDLGAYETREAAWFAERWLALASGWELIRDGELVEQGGEGVVVPDFSFRKDGRVAHLEILGFWRKGTVERRLALMRRYGPENLIVAVSKRQCGENTAELGDAVVAFGEMIPAKEVLRRVERVAR